MDLGIDFPMDPPAKRKMCDLGGDISDIEDDSKSQKMEGDDTKKQNHSEIEKRRRDKMNTYITELSSMVPMCNAMSRKLDKLTVLRMAVQHMKTLRGSINSYTEGHYKPSCLSDEELKQIILQTAEGFLFVVSCDRGRILYMSESVQHILNYSQGDLLGQSWFDILHPKDIAKVKEQLSSSDLSPKERLIDAKTMLPLKTDIPQSQTRLCPGARRSFFCRMKCKLMKVKEEADTTTGCHRRRKSQNSDRRYCVIHCTGYLKSWAPAKLNLPEESEGDTEGCNLSCLVAVGRVHHGVLNLPAPKAGLDVRPIEFVSRHAMDGKFLFVDHRATLVLGYLPQELLGTSCYEYYFQDDIPYLAESHKKVLQSGEKVCTQPYRFRIKEGSFIYLQTRWKSFKNPWTREFEYLVAVNTLVSTPDVAVVESSNSNMEEMMSSNSNSLDVVLSSLPSGSSGPGCLDPSYKVFGTRVGAGKIGRQIADEAMEIQKSNESSTSNSPVSVLETMGLTGRLPSTTSSANATAAAAAAAAEDSRKSIINAVPTENLSGSSVLNGDVGVSVTSPQSNHNEPFTGAASENPNMGDQDLDFINTLVGREIMNASYQNNNNNEGNDEAAMAVIMSLLEADAGLGGPVDFSGMPWPLP